MPIAVSFDNLNYSGLLNGFSCKIMSGTRVLIITAREEESALMAGLMTGLTLPESGSVSISGITIAERNRDALLHIRTGIGIVPSSGGLVSNLKVWENIFLPYHYHRGKPATSDEELAEDFLRELHYSGKLMALPAHLTLYEKRVIAFVRAAVMKPDILIYCNIFDKISLQQQSLLSITINRFHAESSSRTSIVLASSADTLSRDDFDSVISIHGQYNC